MFVIPVIIQEQPTRNPIRILQHSAMTLKRTWGESLIGYLGFSGGSMLIVICWLSLLLIGGVAGLVFRSVSLLIGVGVGVLVLILVGYVTGVAGHVYLCAVYKYAAEGVVPEPYNQDLLDMAWKVKAQSGAR